MCAALAHAPMDLDLDLSVRLRTSEDIALEGLALSHAYPPPNAPQKMHERATRHMVEKKVFSYSVQARHRLASIPRNPHSERLASEPKP